MTLLLLFNAPASSGGATGTAFQSFVEAGMFLGNWEIDDYLTFTACTHDDTGAEANADAAPSYAIYEDETAAAIVSGNMAQLGAVTGFYTERVQLTAVNGFEAGKCYAVRVAAVVGGVTAAAAHAFAVKPALALEATAQAILEDTGTTLPGLIAGVGAGSGTGVYTDTLESPSGTPVDGARVILATDVDGENVAYEARTDAFGVFEMRPDPGTYYRFIEAAGHTFTQGVEVEVTEP